MTNTHKIFITIAVALFTIIFLYGMGDFVWSKHSQYGVTNAILGTRLMQEQKNVAILDTRLTQEKQKGHLTTIAYEKELARLQPPQESAE